MSRKRKVKVEINSPDRKTDVKIVIWAMTLVAILEGVALCLGFNGQMLRWTTIIIALLGGLIIPVPKINQFIRG